MIDAAKPLPAILYVDDEPTALKYFQRALGAQANVLTAESVEEGKRMLDQHADTIAVLVSDQRMPGAYGNELLFYAWDRYPHIVRILTTAFSEIAHTVEAVNQGQIHRYIQKPWDISALRMEMKQAVELARLRREHAQLLREKLLIRQKQAVANRIGTLYALCAGVAGEAGAQGAAVPIEAYLAAALCAGLTPPEPDWLMMDYSDLISSEAFRSAAFAAAVRTQLDGLLARGGGAADVFDRLAEVFADGFDRAADGGTIVHTSRLTEFLETPTASTVSQQHAFWLAALLWLGTHGQTLQMAGGPDGVHVKLVGADAAPTPAQLAGWIEQF
ncbi:two-component system probable response regulator PhcQ [Pseudoduganella flava]|uniref:Response regulator n=1 Tax=Pseudoduganella flava TaxID=871742 RepID=A0A562PQI6_9BURK|nr:response regulator [Pseudoduganella flava]QGZ37871.1 response regulator [Pseudoduganella flava]TWI46702.1 two-component system probable response regulator PhcQ [Pseudoduganella flava]